MKTLLIVLMALFFSVNAYSQDFTVTTGLSSGLNIDAQGNFTEVQGTFNVSPQLAFDKFTVSVVGLSLIQAELPIFYAGSELAYAFWQNNSTADNTIAVTGRYLYGSGGEQLFGVGLDYNISKANTAVNAKADWNYKMKTALVTLGISYEFLK
jgi:hypothetical protein